MNRVGSVAREKLKIRRRDVIGPGSLNRVDIRGGDRVSGGRALVPEGVEVDYLLLQRLVVVKVHTLFSGEFHFFFVTATKIPFCLTICRLLHCNALTFTL